MSETNDNFGMWGILELMGHDSRPAGTKREIHRSVF